ncbi:bifunctional 3,4-dihydroxy-2-butanone 4-phosphate synthase/GTP cyclohydrolase II protein [Janibacter hoylei PVAS-1]|uniref:3,4-dihydroxy-2-butanone-4-phosphate synthase n=1 Tax=Janibacter hoylei PVAS-1 TaxID=1210046 RepID=K1EAV0_9MICO|nr:bifunctional 3,4-dihydroxy-2-butanone 4-phosphate synthase/GTP cyclohydrolase II protein [Janibacter hoylei PVAS-1]
MTHDETLLDPIESAIEAIADGRPVLVVDDADRENEGDIIFAADAATDELMGLTVRLGSGVICVAMTGGDLDRLALPPMTAINEDAKGTAYSVSVDAREGVTTGISAADRARTARLLADPATGREDLARPGHVFPPACPGRRRARAARPHRGGSRPVPAGRSDPGRRHLRSRRGGRLDVAPAAAAPPRRRAVLAPREHRRPRRPAAPLRGPRRQGRLDPTAHGRRRVHRPRLPQPGRRQRARRPRPRPRLRGRPARAGAQRVPDGGRLRVAAVRLRAAARGGPGGRRRQAGAGVVVYVRGHEGRGIGLVDKLRAYAAQDEGADTVDANADLGLPVDARDYTHAAQVLRDLGITRARLLSNNPAKVAALTALGVEVVERVPLPPSVTSDNLHYLRTKRDRMGHDLPCLPDHHDEGSTR